MTEPVAAAAPKSRLPLILGLGAAAILALLLLNVLGGGDDEAAVDDEATTTTSQPSAAGATTTTAPGAAPAETFEVFTTKNPFLPLRTTGGSTVGTGTGGSTGGGTSTGGTATGGTTATTSRGGTTATTTRSGTSGSGSSSGSGRGSGSVEPRRSDRVALVDVFAENGRVVANVRVNDTVHKVSEGETFAGSYRVLSLSQADDCGRFMFGDDTFRLCRGEETLK